MQHNIEEYKSVLTECLNECKKMLEFETEKRKALLGSDMSNLSAVLQAQQVTLMKLENIEKKRVEAQEKAGLGEMKADEILETIENPTQKKSFESVINELRVIVEEIQRVNKISIDIAKSSLKIANTILQQEQGETAGVYTSQGKNSNWAPESSFEEKI